MVFTMRLILAAAVLLAVLPSELLAGAWTLPKGHIWSKVTFLNQSTNEEYVAVGGGGRAPDLARIFDPGDRARYRFDGSYDSRTVFIDMFFGVTDRFDVGFQLPFFRQQFQDSALLPGFGEPRKATGLSDFRGFLKYNLIQEPLLGTLKLGFKAPMGKFENKDGPISVGEGQWDIDIIWQMGRSF